MFTGIITDLGHVRSKEDRGDWRFVFETAYDVEKFDIGDSIACSGVCLTVVKKGTTDQGQGWFAADVSAETLSKTTLGDWQKGTVVNLERALRMGDELGGHLVSGHVDGVAEITGIERGGGRLSFAVAAQYHRFVAPKGSVVLDGVSLTVNDVSSQEDGRVIVGVNIIPHTAAMTTFGQRAVGDRINFEVDLIARYVAQSLDCRSLDHQVS